MADNIIRICEVVDIDDKKDGNRIKVRVLPEDSGLPLSEIPYAFPLLPQMMHIKPKLHEAVLIISGVLNDSNKQRYYIGPVISQINHMEEENFLESTNLLQDANEDKADKALSLDKAKTEGAIPKDGDIAICGRKNSDIILGDNDLYLRCGVKSVDELDKRSFRFNNESPAYIKLKYQPNGISGKNVEDNRCNSTATIVADKINLISNTSKEHFTTNKQTELVDDEVMNEILTKAHQLPYGDILVEFLTMFRLAFLTHTHPYPMLPPCKDVTYKNVSNYNLFKMLSDGIRIN